MGEDNDFWAACKCSNVVCEVSCWHKKITTGLLAALLEQPIKLVLISQIIVFLTKKKFQWVTLPDLSDLPKLLNLSKIMESYRWQIWKCHASKKSQQLNMIYQP